MAPARRPPAAAPAPAQVQEVLGPVVEREGGGPAGWPETMAEFLAWLMERNAAVNLISRRTAGEALTRHVLPSLAVLPLVKPGTALRLLDIGSGGGFPGIPLRILRPDIRLDLVEATRNKCRFLEECLDRLRWTEAAAHWCRIEEPARGLLERAPFDLAVARAVGDEARIRPAAAALLRPGGTAWAFAPPGAPPSPSPGRLDLTDDRGRAVTALRRLV